MRRSRLQITAFGSLLAACLSVAACDDGGLPSDTTGTSNQGGAGAAGGQGTGAQGGAGAQGGGGGTPDCFESPKTHVEIINACTDAEHVDKQPVLPLLNADGSLPPLP